MSNTNSTSCSPESVQPKTVQAGIPPHFPIEDRRLEGREQRLNMGEGRRYHERHLRPMCGAFLTILDEEGRILFFAGGAQRRRDGNQEQLLVMTPQDLARGYKGQEQPEYRVITPGEEYHRGQFTVELRECPFLSIAIASKIPEARSWGVLRVGPDDGEAWRGAIPNGQNSERFLDERSWRVDLEAGIPDYSGGNDLTVRLAPQALGYAREYPSAWQLAVVSAKLFGGMARVPQVDVIVPSAVIGSYVDSELTTREKKKASQDARRAADMAARRTGRSYAAQRQEFKSLLSPEDSQKLGEAFSSSRPA